MASEITMSDTLQFNDALGADEALQANAIAATSAGLRFIKAIQSIGFASAEAIVLGEVTAPGVCMFINRDKTNFIKLLTGTGGVIFAKLLPGESARLRLGSGAQAPFAQADTAACRLEYLVIET